VFIPAFFLAKRVISPHIDQAQFVAETADDFMAKGGGACQATVGPLKIRFLAQKTRIYAIKYSALLRCATQKLIWQRN
jgi:hypothetical protein